MTAFLHHYTPTSPPTHSARHYNSDLSFWLSVDPMVDKYPSTSPYTYCGNNPVRLVDLDGREVRLIGQHCKEAFRNMQQATNLKLSMGKFGLITAQGEAISEAVELLLEAINSRSVCAVIVCVEDGSAGSYMGTTYNKEKRTAVSINNVNVKKMSKIEKKENAPTGSGIIHEVTEGYCAGIIAIDTKHDIMAAVVHQTEPPTPLPIPNTQQYFKLNSNTWSPDNPKEYKKYHRAHKSASLAPNEMSSAQKMNYKNPSLHYLINKYFPAW